jgi:hypothetical protein
VKIMLESNFRTVHREEDGKIILQNFQVRIGNYIVSLGTSDYHYSSARNGGRDRFGGVSTAEVAIIGEDGNFVTREYLKETTGDEGYDDVIGWINSETYADIIAWVTARARKEENA